MSAEATGWVYRHSPYRGAAFLVHLAVADSVNDQNGNEFWMAVGKLATKARIARPTTSEALGQLVTDGFVALLEERPGGTNRYQFLFPDAPVVYETRRSKVSPETTPTTVEVSPPASGGVTPGGTNPSDPKGTTPQPPASGGRDATHRGQHTNCRACGTNPRGPAPEDAGHAARSAALSEPDRRAANPCKQCDGDKLVDALGGTVVQCPRCQGTGIEPSRRVS